MEKNFTLDRELRPFEPKKDDEQFYISIVSGGHVGDTMFYPFMATVFSNNKEKVREL